MKLHWHKRLLPLRLSCFQVSLVGIFDQEEAKNKKKKAAKNDIGIIAALQATMEQGLLAMQSPFTEIVELAMAVIAGTPHSIPPVYHV